MDTTIIDNREELTTSSNSIQQPEKEPIEKKQSNWRKTCRNKPVSTKRVQTTTL